MKNKNLTEEEYKRFIKCVIIKGDCWEWQNHKDKDGYGVFGLRRKNRRAHRVSYYAHFGMIKEGYVIHHRCNNKSCVNPIHLEQVSVRENNLFSNNVGAVNYRKTKCKNGHSFDKKYGKQRYCSVCQKEKTKRLREKWKLEPLLLGI